MLHDQTSSDRNNRESEGILYYARGQKWIKEAIQSAQSVKVVMPDIRTAIVSDELPPQDLFDIHIKAPIDVGEKELKMWSLSRTPFEKTLYLDTDTYVVDSIWEMFEMLDHFEIVAALTPWWTIRLEKDGGPTVKRGIPVSFPEFNSGVLMYRKNQQTDCFFADWAMLYTEWGGGQDQPPFRHMLYNSGIRFGVLPSAYNFRLPFPNGIWGAVKIFHGREKHMAAVCDKINRSGDMRITSPLLYEGASIRYVRYGPGRLRHLLGRLYGKLLRR